MRSSKPKKTGSGNAREHALDLFPELLPLRVLEARGGARAIFRHDAGIPAAIEVMLHEAHAALERPQVAGEHQQVASDLDLVASDAFENPLGGDQPRGLVAVDAAEDDQRRPVELAARPAEDARPDTPAHGRRLGTTVARRGPLTH
jgi:hypothetical protein